MLSAIDRNHYPQSIGTPVRNRRNPQLNPCTRLPTVLVAPANRRSVPTAVAGETPNNRTRIGVISEPPPTPVTPTSAPTMKPAMAKCGSTECQAMLAPVIRAKRRVVLLAEAGSGKSTEMKARALALADDGRTAAYSTVEDYGLRGREAAPT